MRKCLMIRKTWQPEDRTGSAIRPGQWVDQPAVDAVFHKFVTETSDGETCAMAIVEYVNGSTETIPLSWLVLQPEEPPILMEGFATLTAQELIPKEQLDRLLTLVEECATNLREIAGR